MKLEQYIYTDKGWNSRIDNSLDSKNTLILIFASPNISYIQKPLNELINLFPNSKFMGCSTSGEIFNNRLSMDRFVVQVIKFEKTVLKISSLKIEDSSKSRKLGQELALSLNKSKLKSVFILSDGLNINGSQLARGISSVFLNDVIVTGGLAGDDEEFKKTWVLVDKKPCSKYVTAIGFYGEDLYVGYSSKSGWDTLGVRRRVTSSFENIVYELDYQPALKLYKKYLGDRAKGLPSTGLLFPLGIYLEKEIKIRTILAIDENKQSITFAGDIPEGSKVTLMKANFQKLIEGASDAIKSIDFKDKKIEQFCCISISCVGRKLVLGQRVEEEIEAVLDILPKNSMQIGYYSYGEISPLSSGKCGLYNQTMTITLIGEY